ncbi:hypothetical protein [Paenibacillus sp. XY044]|uniref:hypothetical protein n=1 Tax=Paenibacillus sp. XY044 TaxID=2026089 RepID=UPI0015C62421|nr:hypothetical protein [Paenibacillus sp. XY044]
MIIRHEPVEYQLLVQGRVVAKGDMDAISEKAAKWAKIIVDVRTEPVTKEGQHESKQVRRKKNRS